LPAAWAATLIPVSLVLAATSILILWRVEPPRANRTVAQAQVDEVVNELVTTPPR
jgi:di/tricarboxylate transporter